MAAKSSKADLNPTTPSDGYRSKPTSSAGKSVRLMSASAVADMLDVNRNTVRRWKTEGMPVVAGPEGEGDAYQIDLADVVKWLIKRAVEKEAGKAKEAAGVGPGGLLGALGMPPGWEPPPGWESEEEANRRRAVAQANIAEMDEEIKAGTVVPIEAMEDLVREEMAACRAKLENIGSTLAGRTARITDPAEVKEVADSLVAEAVKCLVGDLSSLITPHV